ncbi:MAG TPA: hypothetical protein VN751_02115 [Solirubrobacteraceae bacterium]|nr:hypothetical protein [Solirubrobacteraceae bacterium]
MATGTIVAESVRTGATLGGPCLTVREIERVAPTNLAPSQLQAGLPTVWTLVRFEVADADAPALAGALAEAMDAVGWYADFHTADESFVLFAGRVFRYGRGDPDARAAAEDYARAHGVPDAQIDWP